MTNLVLPPLSNPFLPHLFCSSSSGSEDGVDEGAASLAVWGGGGAHPCFLQAPQSPAMPPPPRPLQPWQPQFLPDNHFPGKDPSSPTPSFPLGGTSASREQPQKRHSASLQRAPSPGNSIKGHQVTALVLISPDRAREPRKEFV